MIISSTRNQPAAHMPIYNKHTRANGGACDYISARCTLGRTSCSVWGCSRRGCGDHYRADLLLWWMGLVSHVSQISNLGFNLNFLFIFLLSSFRASHNSRRSGWLPSDFPSCEDVASRPNAFMEPKLWWWLRKLQPCQTARLLHQAHSFHP